MDFNLKRTEKVKWLRNALGLIFIGISLTACALGVDRVKLYDPLTYKPVQEEGAKVAYADVQEIKPIAGEKIKVVIKGVRDNRPDITRIGVKKNAYGMAMGSVDVEKDVVFLELFTKNLINCFELAGYEAIPIKKFEATPTIDKEKAKAFIESEIRTFWVEFIPGFFVVDAASNVIFEIRLFEPETNREIWSETFRGKGKVSGMAVTRAMFERSINLAYTEAMRSFYKTISDEKYSCEIMYEVTGCHHRFLSRIF
jgi:hypothetical protein